MAEPVAKDGDDVVAIDTHIVLVSSPGGPVPTMMPMPVRGPLSRELAASVFVDGKAVAVVGSKADNQPQHIPIGGPFQSSPSNEGTVAEGSTTVFIDGKGVARNGDPATTCNDPTDQQVGHVVASGTAYAAG